MLLYRINLFTRVPVYFQQKYNLPINDYIDPQCVLAFVARTWYAKWRLFCVAYCLCAGNIFEHGNPIVSYKYEYGDMNKTIIVIIAIYSPYLLKYVYHYSQQLASTLLNRVLTRKK